MPRKQTYNKRYKLTWRPKEHRWQKFYKGQVYYFPVDRSVSMEASYKDALRLFEIKKGQILAGELGIQTDQNGYSVAKAIAAHEQFRNLALAVGNTESAARTKAKIDDLSVLPPNAKVNKWDADPMKHITPEGRLVWRELAKVVSGETPHVKQKTILEAINDFIETKESQVGAKIRHSTHRIARIQLYKFIEWLESNKDLQPSSPAKYINASIVERYNGYLNKQIASNAMKSSYCRNCWGIFKTFIHWADELEYLTKPKNIDSRRLSIRVSIKEIHVIPKEHILQCLDAANDEDKLHILCGLNFGCTMRDIVDMRRSEVDLEAGTVKRRRSKTSHIEATPVVTYKIWETTLQLMRKVKPSTNEFFFSGTYENKISKGFRDLQRDKLKIKYYSFKHLRKTGSTMLDSSNEYSRFSKYYLGHSPKSMADKHYSRPSDDRFFEALEWMRAELGI